MRWLRQLLPILVIWVGLWGIVLQLDGLTELAYRTERFDLWASLALGILAPLIWFGMTGVWRMLREARPTGATRPNRAEPSSSDREVEFD